MHSHKGTRLPLPLPRAAASKNRCLSSSAAFAAALPLITALALPAQHRADFAASGSVWALRLPDDAAFRRFREG